MANIQLPHKFSKIFNITTGDLIPSRYKFFRGGRGGGKSYCVADLLLDIAFHGWNGNENVRIWCAREFQNSIDDSVLTLLEERSEELFPGQFETKNNKFYCKRNGSVFIFSGLARNTVSVCKGKQSIDICWIEEGQAISLRSWQHLVPSVRNEGSEIWITYNPDNEDDVVHREASYGDSDRSIVVDINYYDNPFLPDVLRDEAEHCKLYNPDDYSHIWEGEINLNKREVIFHGRWEVSNFETPDDVNYLFGADYGSGGEDSDPSTLVRGYIYDSCLYIDYAEYSWADIDDLESDIYQKVPFSESSIIRGDSAAKAHRRYLLRQGYKVIGAKKGKDSILNGINYLKGFDRIYLHPRCSKYLIEEFKKYKWKVDSADQITNTPIDRYNHGIDSIRYMIEPYMKMGVYQ